MLSPLDLHHRNPCRPPDWRWLRAVGIADEGQQRPTIRRDGEANIVLVRKLVVFRRAYMAAQASDDISTQMTVVDNHPALAWAHAIYSNTDQSHVRCVVEARILARQTNAEIAARVGTEEDIIDIYEKVFFSVRDRLQDSDYIFQVVMGKTLHASLSTVDNYGILWKLFGYAGGPLVLDAISRRIVNPTWVSRPEETLAFFHDVAVSTMKQRAAVAAATIAVNSHTNMAILESFVKYVEVERMTDGAGKSESQLLNNVSDMLGGLKSAFVVGTRKDTLSLNGYSVFDSSAVELRGEEMLQLAAGGLVADQAALLSVEYPPINQEA